MAAADLFLSLRSALSNLKSILDTNTATIKSAIQALKPVLPQAGDVVNQVVALMNQLKTTIQNLDVSNVPGLSPLSNFATSAESLLLTAEDLLPGQENEISTVLGELSVVAGLPSLVAVRQDILTLIDGVIADLNALN